MKTAARRALSGLAAMPLALTLSSIASAQSPADFYKAKTVDLHIGYSAGGAYDLYARMIARHLGKHIPGNPQVVPKNMEGAGSLRLANYLYSVAPKDGTALGATSRGMAFDPLLGNKTAQYEAPKFTWIGSANDEVSVCVAWHSSARHRLDRCRRRHLPVSQVRQQRARRQVQDHHRLSGWQRREHRDGAR
jgi:tripartite-type tricarboxylate transporter receptor subunit TctC